MSENGGTEAELLVETVEKLTEIIQGLLVENNEYRKVLEFYADTETYEEEVVKAIYQGGEPLEFPSGEPPIIYFDRGQEARKVLRVKRLGSSKNE